MVVWCGGVVAYFLLFLGVLLVSEVERGEWQRGGLRGDGGLRRETDHLNHVDVFNG